EPLLEPVRVILVARNRPQRGERRLRLRHVTAERAEIVVRERALQPRRKLVPLRRRGKLILLLDLRRRERVEKLFAGLIEIVRGRRRRSGRRRRLRGERQREQRDQPTRETPFHVISRAPAPRSSRPSISIPAARRTPARRRRNNSSRSSRPSRSS